MTPGLIRNFPVKKIDTHNGVAHYRVQLFAETGYWWEDFQSREVNGHDAQALRIVRYTRFKPTVLYEQADPDYPRGVDHMVDWEWAAKEP